MTAKHLYSEHNPYRAAVLRERIEDGLLPAGVVDERDIEKIPDEDFLGYGHVHLFAGIGGFPLGMRGATPPLDHIRIVTGGFPCQDISNAGKRAGITGSRSGLWREMVRCIRVVRPQLVFVENVAALLGRGMGVVLGDLAEIGYDARGDCISAADVGAPHLRRRIWIVAYANTSGFGWPHAENEINGSAVQRDGQTRHEFRSGGGEEFPYASIGRARAISAGSRTEGDGAFDFDGSGETLADAAETRCDGWTREKQSLCGRPLLSARSGRCGEVLAGADSQGLPYIQGSAKGTECDRSGTPGGASRWPVEPNVGRVAHGIPKRVDRLAALGDAIVPQCVEEMLRRLKL